MEETSLDKGFAAPTDVTHPQDRLVAEAKKLQEEAANARQAVKNLVVAEEELSLWRALGQEMTEASRSIGEQEKVTQS